MAQRADYSYRCSVACLSSHDRENEQCENGLTNRDASLDVDSWDSRNHVLIEGPDPHCEGVILRVTLGHGKTCHAAVDNLNVVR